MSAEQFEPIIIGFLCNWCAYGGADLRGRQPSPISTKYTHNSDPVFRHCWAATDIEGFSKRDRRSFCRGMSHWGLSLRCGKLYDREENRRYEGASGIKWR